MINYIDIEIESNEGLTIQAQSNESLNDLKVEDIRQHLSEHGILLLRNFDISLESYSKFVGSILKTVTLDPARNFVSKEVQLVDSGYDEIPLHCENGLTPFPPDILFFMCEIPASRGSQTTYCDGVQVWEHLSSPAKEYFSSHQFTFERVIPNNIWKNYVVNQFKVEFNEENVQTILAQLKKEHPEHTVQVNDDGSILARLSIPLVHKTLFSNKLAFANSLIGPSFNYSVPIIRDELGNALVEKYVEEFRTVSQQLTRDHLWQKHDLLIIDNTRYMHGRRKIEDTNRKIYLAMGNL
ncbi:TauD/TfdA family dioxygenase [Fluoribacter gormanii]|uniref:TauD/TfdA family dioxygenase n=1 Tax=Fluoribacter gormanii TaxID=464 RepID=UPI00104138BF|nr:TauD/TfdA family dioxygenase [Fluoribacter gormanii]MCW8471343.1 TauD/TfdA family dioxygenase [Fluoribacter gormanii]